LFASDEHIFDKSPPPPTLLAGRSVAGNCLLLTVPADGVGGGFF
jgi:hypothetical protein